MKTHEELVAIQNDLQTISLLNQNSIKSHLEEQYRFIHIGLVQVAIKPLAKRGVDAPIYLAFRDTRLNKYKTSLLAMIQTNYDSNKYLQWSNIF